MGPREAAGGWEQPRVGAGGCEDPSIPTIPWFCDLSGPSQPSHSSIIFQDPSNPICGSGTFKDLSNTTILWFYDLSGPSHPSHPMEFSLCRPPPHTHTLREGIPVGTTWWQTEPPPPQGETKQT